MAEEFGLKVTLSLHDRISGPMAQLEKRFKSIRDAYELHGAGMRKLGKSMSTYFSLPLAGLGLLAVNTARSFDDAFGQMKKNVQAPVADIEKLRDTLVQMSTRVPVAGEELLKMSASLARLNVPTDKLTVVTETMAEFIKATGIQDVEGVTKNFIRFAQAGGIAEKEYTNLASTLFDLDNITNVGEENILQMGMDVSGLGKMIGLTTAQILGLAAGIGSLGAEAVQPIKMIMLQMNKIASGTDKTSKDRLAGMGNITNLGAAGFKKMWKEDAVGALTLFAKNLDEFSKKKGTDALAVLDALGMDGARTAELIAKLAGNTDKVTKAMVLSTKAYADNVGYTEHVRIEHDKLNAKMVIFYNKLRVVMLQFGNIVIPILTKALDIIGPLLDKFEKLPKWVKIGTVAFGGLLIVLGPLIHLMGSLAGIIAAMTAPTSIAALSAMAVPLGLIAAALLTIVGTIKAIKNLAAGDVLGSTGFGLAQNAILGKGKGLGSKNLNEIVLRIVGNGASAVVQGVKKSGDTALSVITGGYLGLTNTAGAQ